MKDAAKCDKRCEWQSPANQENAERILHLEIISEGMSVSGRLQFRVIEIFKGGIVIATQPLVSVTLLCVSVVEFQPPTYEVAQCRTLTFSHSVEACSSSLVKVVQ